jgi:hypothetical protein
MRLHLPALAAASLALTAATPAAAGATTTSEKIYGGHTTTQFAPFALRVGADGRTLTGLLIQVDFDCDAGYGASWSGAASFRSFTPGSVQPEDNFFNPARTASDGTFSSTGEAVGRYGEDDVGTITETLSGTLRRGTAAGTYSATLVLRNPATGATDATCQSGTVRWKARSAPQRVYAGLTAAGEPLVIERTRDGRKAKILWVGWTAPCPSGGAYEIGEGLTDFPIARNGRFGDRWTDKARRYTVRGKIRGSRASGVFGVDVTRIDLDGDGASVELCRSKLAKWSARSSRA